MKYFGSLVTARALKQLISLQVVPHVVGAQLYRLSTVDAHTDVLKPIHGKII